MSRIAQLVSEIKDAGPQPTQTNALRIFRILDSNAALFKESMEAVNFIPILEMFSRLGDSNIRDFNNGYFKEDYTRAYELLVFYLNRI
jgi:hypothetical protein